jgi:serine/threonine-protein kinase
MRRTAVEILNTTKDARAYDYLTKALQDPDWWVRERAIDALANLGDTRAVPALIDILTSDSQASGVAIRALASLGDSIAAEPVLNCLGSSDESVQREALEALPTLASNKNWKSIAERLRAFAPADASLHDAAQRGLTEVQARFSARGAPRRTNTLPAGRSPNASAAGMTSLSKQLGDDATADRTMEVTTTSPSEVPAAATQTAAAAVAAASQASDMLDFGAIYAGQILGGRYKVARELGRGGFGTVLQVEDQMVGEVIALKLINPQLVRDESAISRFIHEVRYARKITHENVIRIHDFLMVGKVYAMSMEYFASHPLARRLRRGLTQNPNLALKFVRDIARGIQVAHNADIVHRDLKPANILVDDNDLLKVVDFGLAAAVSHADSRVTKTGHLVGTPTYMAPEQARGLDIDGRTDIYSLGVIMYEMFTGAPPYAGDNPLAVMYQHIEGNKVPPRERNPALAPAMEALILKAMALRPEDRYQSMKALLDDAEGLNLKVTA